MRWAPSVVDGVGCPTVPTSWVRISLLARGSSATNLDPLRSVRFQSFKLDLQYPIIDACLDLVSIDPEGQLDNTRESTVSALPALPVHVFLLGLRFALADAGDRL